ncbi:hypothetical protein RHGRI_024658 [Rhododendron griersonianum]|uniref:Magnesium-protoporphyrin IX methyltransferase C-terminal domain-containing protein n=1 Tax=Rhododendron griersonianum TaxID=479676 RepID=A0AAV6J835_9ERIC|nr:hypothetical protein RHGRI_024658 [Rhododendron griersonianum]
MACSSPLSSTIRFRTPPIPFSNPKFSPKPKRKTPTVFAIPPPSATVDGTTLAVIGGSSVVALAAAALSLADPEMRRRSQAEEVGGGDKEVVREYFNSAGFQRWKKIYGETDDVNRVQRAREELLTGNDELSPAPVMSKFEVKDLESLAGKFDTVVCLDVLIHYPQSKADGMIAHLASLADNRLILSFAPKTLYYNLLKRVGELFPGPSKATRAYLHAEAGCGEGVAQSWVEDKEERSNHDTVLFFKAD